VTGAVVLVERLHRGGDQPVHAAWILLASWMLALVAAPLVRWALPARRPVAPHALVKASIVLPGVGAALLLPLTVHLPFALFPIGLAGMDAFDTWARLSYALVAPAHVVLAVLVALRGVRLARRPAPSIGSVYLLTLAAAWLPSLAGSGLGALLQIIPAVVVALTGIVFVPVLLAMEAAAARDLPELEHDASLPRAVAGRRRAAV
jgi:hypothetical protein